MTLTLRLVLLLASVLNSVWVLSRIRKTQIKIEDAVFWILWSFLLIFMGIFPQIVLWGAKITGVETPLNFLFLVIMFVSFLKLLQLSVRLSQLESRLQIFVQTYALDQENGYTVKIAKKSVNRATGKDMQEHMENKG